MALSDLTDDESLIEIAECHSRMVEVAIVNGNRAQAHRAVDRAFECWQSLHDIDLDAPVDSVINGPIGRNLRLAGISTVGELCAHTKDSLAQVYQIRYRSVSLIEHSLAKVGLRLRRS